MQRQKISEILSEEHGNKVVEMSKIVREKEHKEPSATVSVCDKSKSENLNVSSENVGEIVNQLIKSTKEKWKSTIKIQIEIINE